MTKPQTASEQIIEEVYLAALSRYPTDAQRAKLAATLSGTSEADRRPLVEDLYWSILSSKEFLFTR